VNDVRTREKVRDFLLRLFAVALLLTPACVRTGLKAGVNEKGMLC